MKRALVLFAVVACGSDSAPPDMSADGPIDVDAADPSDTPAALPRSLAYLGLSGATTGECSTSYDILVEHPSGTGRFPLYIHVAGTQEPYDDMLATGSLAYMASKGFVAASIDYPHANDNGCAALRNKIGCMFDDASPTSAIHALCELRDVDCARGIVTSGISQGSQIAVMAGDVDSRIKATYAISTGDILTAVGVTIDMTDCMDPPPLGTRITPSSQIRAIDGELDQFFGKASGTQSADNVRTGLEHVTGTRCGPAAFDCLASHGTGWYEVRQAEMTDPTIEADHFYVRDPGYEPPNTLAWSMTTNLDWLAARITGP